MRVYHRGVRLVVRWPSWFAERLRLSEDTPADRLARKAEAEAAIAAAQHMIRGARQAMMGRMLRLDGYAYVTQGETKRLRGGGIPPHWHTRGDRTGVAP